MKNELFPTRYYRQTALYYLCHECTLPLTGVNCITKVVTDLGVFEINDDGFRCVEYAPGVTIEEIKAKTAGRLVIADDVKEVAI